jgi:hypothetical protein
MIAEGVQEIPEIHQQFQIVCWGLRKPAAVGGRGQSDFMMVGAKGIYVGPTRELGEMEGPL